MTSLSSRYGPWVITGRPFAPTRTAFAVSRGWGRGRRSASRTSSLLLVVGRMRRLDDERPAPVLDKVLPNLLPKALDDPVPWRRGPFRDALRRRQRPAMPL